MKPTTLYALVSVAIILVACGGPRYKSTGTADGAPSIVLSPSKIKNPVPRVEPKSPGGNRSPYTVFGKQYHVLDSADGFRQRGTASWYGTKFHGRPTANGEQYDMYKLSAAHKNLPLPTYVQVRRLDNNKTVIVRVNDRGPFHGNRVIDLSYAAAAKLGMLGSGTTTVEITAITPRQANTKTITAGTSTPKTNTAAIKPLGTSTYAQPTNENCHYVQVGAFSRLDAAQDLQSRLLGKISEDIVIHPSNKNTPLYRVKIGALYSANQTRAVQNTLASLNLSENHIVSCSR